MYCRECGNKVDENSKFCNRCGSKIKLNFDRKEEKNYKEDNNIIEKSYSFSKRKWLGLILLSIIETNIGIKCDKLYIEQQKKHLGLFKGSKKTAVLKVKDIKSMTRNKAIDLIDGIYAIIFAILGLIAPPLFLVSLVCLWTGYGERLTLEHNGIKTRIHIDRKSNVNEFISYINLDAI